MRDEPSRGTARQRNAAYQRAFVEKHGRWAVYKQQLVRRIRRGYVPLPTTALKYGLTPEDVAQLAGVSE